MVKQHLDNLGLHTRVRSINTQQGTRTTGGLPFRVGHIHWLLRNPVYAGQVRHKEQVWPGDHQAIIGEELWQRVQQTLSSNAVERSSARAAGTRAC